jgi:hypothetical protein
MVRAKRRIYAGFVNFTHNRNVLRRVLGDENGNLRVFEEAPADELIANQSLSFARRETLQVHRAYQRQNHVASVAYSQLSAEFRSVEDAHFDKIAGADGAGGAASETAAAESSAPECGGCVILGKRGSGKRQQNEQSTVANATL